MSDYKFKIIVIGDAGVGKTSLVSRFAGLDVSESYMSTIGVEVNSTLSESLSNVRFCVFIVTSSK